MRKVGLFKILVKAKFIFSGSVLITGMFISGYCFSQSVVINEVMSSNISTIEDEDGEFPDWIEIYNSDLNAIDLTGCYLSDDSTDIFKWRIPNVILGSQDFFAHLCFREK